MSDFDERLRIYRFAKADMDRHCAVEQSKWDADHDRQLDILSTAHTVAMDNLLLTPARDSHDLNTKLRITVEERVHDNWHLASAIMALLVDDSERLLEPKYQSEVSR